MDPLYQRALKEGLIPRAKFKWKHERMLYSSKNLGFRHWSQARCITALRPRLYFIFPFPFSLCLSYVKSQPCVRHGVFVLQFTSSFFPLPSDLKWACHLCRFIVLEKRVVQTLGTLEYVHGLPGFTVEDTELPETDSQWKTILGEP